MKYQHISKSELAGELPAGGHVCEYSALLDSMGVSISKFLIDEDFPILWANDLFYRNTGFTKEEYQSRFKNLRQYYQEYSVDYQNLIDTVFQSLEEEKSEFQTTSRLPVKGGGFIWIQIKGTIPKDPVDGCRVCYANISDVSGMVKRQDETNSNFEWMLDEYVGNIYISDMDSYELLYVNKNSCSALHRTKEELLGHKCYEMIQGRTSPCPFCNNDILKKDEVCEWEFHNPVLERKFIIKDKQLDWYGHKARLELSHDMYSTEYKLAKKDQEREALVKTIPGGLSRVDARDYSTILWYAGDFLQMIGYTEEQFETELCSQCTYLQKEDLERAQKMMQSLQVTGKHSVLEARVTKRSGEQRIMTITFCYVSGEDSWDGIPSCYSVAIDVTEERTEQQRQRRALEEAYQAVRVANSAKTNFLSSMSHDIRTPMNAIMGMTAIARVNLNSPDRMKDCLNKINVSSRHLLSLINEVLDMSKIESGKIDLIPEKLDLSELVQSVSDMCRSLVTEKGQDFQINIGQVRHEKIVADGDRLQQVFMNLLSNAIKYTPEGGKISLMINEMPSFIPQKGRFEFVFTDNGIGMSSEFISRIFEPFSRAEDSRISKTQGTGLGMAITENIVHMMNGTIEVISEPGKGSQFTVSIPLELQPEAQVSDNELSGLPVLVVDDDQMVCENATLLLNELGMRGYWVLSGAEAVRHVKGAHNSGDDFFAVILDWKMPEMDGLETVKAIRQELGDDVPIIIISAYDYSEIEADFVDAGADAFITKPLFKSKMLHVLQLFCASNKMEASNVLVEETHPDLCGKRVLLAEDNELNREIAIELLQMQGILADWAENGKQAVSMYQKSEPGYYAAILMDIQMPVMDGYQATEAIRSMEREDAGKIPILALTANAFVSDIGKVQRVGMNDHIAKPIDIEHLITVLHKWIGKKTV